MKTNTLSLMLLGAILVSSITLKAQITAKEAVVEMGRGINLGNTFDAPNYEGEWGHAAQEFYFDMYADAGFKTVRIPITWNVRLGTSDPYAIDEDFAKRIDTVVNWALDRGLYAIINVHHDGWIKEEGLFDEQKPRFYALWEQLSKRYKDYPEKLLFEIINEPHSDNSITADQLNELNSATLEIIRMENPTRVVIYGGTGWSSSQDLFDVAIPDTADNYLMGYYHSYDPWGFAGEGEGTWGSASDIKEMEDQMIRVENWSKKNDLPVLIGEFGAQKKCEYNSRMMYYSNYSKLALKHGFAYTIWDDDGDFQALVRVDSVWNDIKDVVIYSTDSTINNVQLQVVEDTAIEVAWTPNGNADLIEKVLVQKRLLGTEFATIAELGTASGTTYLDRDATTGEESFYRVVDVYANESIPSYPQSYWLLGNDRSPYDGVIAIPGTIEAENFDVGGEMLTYHDTDRENNGEAYRLTEGVDIEEREDGFQVGYVEAGEWLEYTVNVAKAAKYKITALLASQDGGGEMTLTFGKTESSVFTAPATGDWVTMQEVSIVEELAAGEQIMRLNIKSIPAFNIDKLMIEEYDGVGVAEHELKLCVYPNPVSSSLNIQLDGQQINEVLIYGSNGVLIKRELIGASSCSLDVEDYSKGVYFVVAKTQHGDYRTTFVK